MEYKHHNRREPQKQRVAPPERGGKVELDDKGRGACRPAANRNGNSGRQQLEAAITLPSAARLAATVLLHPIYLPDFRPFETYLMLVEPFIRSSLVSRGQLSLCLISRFRRSSRLQLRSAPASSLSSPARLLIFSRTPASLCLSM